MSQAEQGTDRYELIDRVAVGGMAEVYRAKAFGAHGFEKTLAIKRILPELAQEPEFEERFIREAKLAVKLSHANVVQVLDFGRFAGSLFIAMEFVDGPDLARLLRALGKQERQVPVAAAFQIAIDLCRGLDYAHKHDVVHRDVSPSNILLSKAGEIKIADFGIAQAAARSSRRTSGWKKIMGKWRYMSPEQTRGEPLTTQSDLFSAASVLFELFTGTKLFPGPDADSIAQNIQEMEIPSVLSLRDDLPPRLDSVLRGALARDPRQRIKTAAVMLRELTEISYATGVVATPLEVSEIVEEATANDKGAAGAGGIDALIRAQLVAGFEIKETTRRTDIQDEDRHTERSEHSQLSAIVSRRVDADGITVWELDQETIAAVPSALRDGRKSGEQPVIRDHEEPGEGARPSRSMVLMGLGVAAVAALAFVGFGLFGGQDKSAAKGTDAATLALADARAPATMLGVSSRPVGATVTVNGKVLPKVTPTEVAVSPGKVVSLRVELDGYEPYVDDSVSVLAGETLRVFAPLRAIRAVLRVKSRPAGASVSLDGVELGVTPLVRRDLKAEKGQVLRISKAGFKPVSETIDLSRGELTLERNLVASRVFGRIDLHIDGGWADVYLKGRRIGRAPAQGLKLPVGKHRLKLVNPPSGKTAYLSVEVKAGKSRYYQAALK